MFALASAVVLALASTVFADPSPLTPATSNVGAPCVISWTPDTNGTWTQTNIELMSGDNQNMVHITTVATLDTTSAAATSYTWTCPDVTPNAAIYFYQFSHAAQPNNLIWTTRWAIASADGTVTQPANALQPDGTGPAWGVGALVDQSTAKPAPPYIVGQTSSGASTNGTSSMSASSSMTMSTSMATISTAPASIVSVPSGMTMSTASASKSASASASDSATTSASSSTSTSKSTSGAERSGVTGAAFALGALAVAGFMVVA